jgi:hypothetical protein
MIRRIIGEGTGYGLALEQSGHRIGISVAFATPH